MNNNFDFDPDALGTDNMAKGVKAAAGVIFFILSAFTTFQFFAQYAPGLGAFAGDNIGPYVSGVMGVILLDAAALVWLYVRSNLCTTQTQMNTALIAAIMTISGALLTSAVYVLLTSQLDIGVTDAYGQLTNLGTALNITGNVIMVSALVVNFGGMFLFEAKDIKIQQAIGRTTLLAQEKQQKLKIALQRQFLTAQAETQRIADKLPTVAHDLGTRQADNYIDQLQTGMHQRPTPQPIRNPGNAGNGVTRRVNPLNVGEDVEPAGPQRQRVASEGSGQVNFTTRANRPE